MINRLRIATALVSIAGTAIAASPIVTRQSDRIPAATAPKKHKTKAVDPQEDPGGSRIVHYRRGDVVSVRTQKHFASAVQIRNEQVMKIVGGDNDDWSADMDDSRTVIVLRPKSSAPRHSKTSLVVTTTSGNIYLLGVSLSDSVHDELITVEPVDKDMKDQAAAPPKFVDSVVVEGLKTELANSHHEAEEIRSDADKRVAEANEKAVAADKRADAEIEKFRASYPGEMSFGYRFKRNASPFYVSAVWHDARFTYISADPDEVGAIYAVKDGKPMLVDAKFSKGLYTVPMLLDGEFYLSVGKKKLTVRKEK